MVCQVYVRLSGTNVKTINQSDLTSNDITLLTCTYCLLKQLVELYLMKIYLTVCLSKDDSKQRLPGSHE